MSVNLSSIRMLKALAKTIDREADHFHSIADRQASEPDVKERLRIAAAVGKLLASACNEAANELHEQDLAGIEQLGGPPRG